MNNSYLTTLALPFLHTSLNLSHLHAMAVAGNSGRSLPNQPQVLNSSTEQYILRHLIFL